jgi:hypothetical protein
MSTAALLGAKGKEDAGEEQPPATTTWLSRVVDTAEARAQLRFAVPMVLTNMAYYGIPLVSVMFSGHLLGSDVHLAGATLGNSWATVTGYAFVVRARPISSPKDHFLLCRLFLLLCLCVHRLAGWVGMCVRLRSLWLTVVVAARLYGPACNNAY